jgi:hypothetical protein
MIKYTSIIIMLISLCNAQLSTITLITTPYSFTDSVNLPPDVYGMKIIYISPVIEGLISVVRYNDSSYYDTITIPNNIVQLGQSDILTNLRCLGEPVLTPNGYVPTMCFKFVNITLTSTYINKVSITYSLYNMNMMGSAFPVKTFTLTSNKIFRLNRLTTQLDVDCIMINNMTVCSLYQGYVIPIIPLVETLYLTLYNSTNVSVDIPIGNTLGQNNFPDVRHLCTSVDYYGNPTGCYMNANITVIQYYYIMIDIHFTFIVHYNS